MELTEPKSELVALIDLDGTVANFNKSLEGSLNEMRGPGEAPFTYADLEEAPPHIEARMRAIKRVPGFWRNLEPIPLGMDVLSLIRAAGYQLNVLTKGPRRNNPAWAEKVDWAQEHLPDAQVTISQDKGLVYGKVLFDDWPPYVERWLTWRKRGLVLMLAHPWNENFSHENVVKIRGPEDFDKVQEALHLRKQS